jgi:hypothetical protein
MNSYCGVVYFAPSEGWSSILSTLEIINHLEEQNICCETMNVLSREACLLYFRGEEGRLVAWE